jgi:YggT family protein
MGAGRRLCQVIRARARNRGVTGQVPGRWLVSNPPIHGVSDAHFRTCGSKNMLAIANLIATVIGLYMWAVIISVVLTWLVQFNVINTSNRMVYQIGDFLYRITEPAMRPIRQVIPSVGGLDLSPLIVILILGFLKQFIPGLLLR